MSNILVLFEHGQSLWLDYAGRDLLVNDSLKQLVTAGLRGATHNSTRWGDTINNTHHYDDTLRDLVQADHGIEEAKLYQWLLIQDTQIAADILHPVYESSQGEDGYVSIDVSPQFAYDTQGTLEAARHLWKEINRPNLMIGVPGTQEGFPAIERLLAEGINVNVTLLCSVSGYEAAAAAYARGVAMNPNPEKVASVASFLISAVDSKIGAQLERRGTPEALSLKGKIALANARLTYQGFRKFIKSDFFLEQQQRGARVQRLLWPNPRMELPGYSDLGYVEGLIGQDTVVSMSPEMLDAFEHQGEIRTTLEDPLGEAERDFKDLEAIGVGFERLMEELQKERIEAHLRAYEQLLSALKEKCQAVMKGYATP